MIGRKIRQFVQDPVTMIAVVVFLLMVIVCTASPLIVDPKWQAVNMQMRTLEPSSEHWFGTDLVGRDLVGRVLIGGRMTIWGSLKVAIIATLIGTFLGILAGYRENTVSFLILRAAEMIDCVPYVLLVTMFAYKFGFGNGSFLYGLACAALPATIQVVRTETMRIRNKEFMEAARALGFNDAHLLFTHVLPNVGGTVLMQFFNNYAEAIIASTMVGYLTIGYATPRYDWGTLTAEGFKFVVSYPFLVFYPTAAVVVTIVCINLINRGVRDVYERSNTAI